MMHASYACHPDRSLGRAVSEPEANLRSPFQRDRDRIVHCTAFRRLENKTQVFSTVAGDHFRTRLTHSLEVAQLTRTLCRTLRGDEDLGEAIALAHDLGHPPFGHAGERALDLALREYGGFDHNIQTFRLLTELEHRYASFDGLNLTVETLEGVIKHNGPLVGSLPAAIAKHPVAQVVELGLQAPVEAQAAAIADDVAYCNHDLDDGLRAGFFAIDELDGLPMVAAAVREVTDRHGKIELPRLHHEVIRRLIDGMLTDIVRNTEDRLARLAPTDPDAVRSADRPMVGFSPAMAEQVAALRVFLRERMYRHYKVNRMAAKALTLITDLAHHFLAQPDCLPTHWQPKADQPVGKLASRVRDYIAGMTDRYAFDEHDRLFKLTLDRA